MNSGVHANVLDLRDYVTDDRTPVDGIIFRIASESHPEVANAEVVGGNLSITVQPGATGESQIIIEAQDTDGEVTSDALIVLVSGATEVPQERWTPMR